MTVKEIAEGYVLDFRDAVQNSAIAQDDKTEEINREKNNFLLNLLMI